MSTVGRPDSRRRAWSASLATALIAIVSIGAAFACGDGNFLGWRYVVEKPAPPTDRPLVKPRRGYIGSDECRSCHASNYESWSSSFHRTMTRTISPANMDADFDVKGIEFYGHRFEFERRGDTYWVEMDDPDWNGQGERERVWKEIVLSTGSHNFQAFWYASGEQRRIDFVPICWRIDEARWMPVHASFLIPPDSDLPMRGRWNSGCHSCHSVAGEPRLKHGDADTIVAELGIGCEACHGPGRAHVLANRDPVRRYQQHASEEGDDTIVNPTDLVGHLSSQVCGQCHALTDLKSDQQIAKWRRTGYTYKPGDDLTETRAFLFEGDSYYWPDGMVRLAGREFSALLRTPCFLEATPETAMSCFSCHRMHQAEDDPRSVEEWRDDQLKVGMRGNTACVQCHTEYASADALTAHTHHPVGPEGASDGGDSGSRCYDCHMPHTSWSLLGSIRSHEVSSPTVAESVRVGRPNACNLCHLDKTLAWSGRWLKEWWGVGRPELSEDERLVAASVLWALSGDAAQRAISAWHMGWAPAQAASGTDWMVPYLARLLDDPYEAVRFTAVRSLRKNPSATGPDGTPFDFDFMASEAERDDADRGLVERWSRGSRAELGPVLLGPGGALRNDVFERLFRNRDETPVMLSE